MFPFLSLDGISHIFSFRIIFLYFFAWNPETEPDLGPEKFDARIRMGMVILVIESWKDTESWCTLVAYDSTKGTLYARIKNATLKILYGSEYLVLRGQNL